MHSRSNATRLPPRAADNRLKRRIVVYLGAKPQRIDDAEALPFDDFVGQLPG